MGGLGDIIPVLALGGAAQGYGQGMAEGKQLAQTAQQMRYQQMMMGYRQGSLQERQGAALQRAEAALQAQIANGLDPAVAARQYDAMASGFGMGPGSPGYFNSFSNYASMNAPPSPDVTQAAPLPGDPGAGTASSPSMSQPPAAPAYANPINVGANPIKIFGNVTPSPMLPPSLAPDFGKAMAGVPAPSPAAPAPTPPPAGPPPSAMAPVDANPSPPYPGTLGAPPSPDMSGSAAAPPPVSVAPPISTPPPSDSAAAPSAPPPGSLGSLFPDNPLARRYDGALNTAETTLFGAAQDVSKTLKQFQDYAAQHPQATNVIAKYWANYQKAKTDADAAQTAYAATLKDAGGVFGPSAIATRDETMGKVFTGLNSAFQDAVMQQAPNRNQAIAGVLAEAKAQLSPAAYEAFAQFHAVPGTLLGVTQSQGPPSLTPAGQAAWHANEVNVPEYVKGTDQTLKDQGFVPTHNGNGLTYNQPIDLTNPANAAAPLSPIIQQDYLPDQKTAQEVATSRANMLDALARGGKTASEIWTTMVDNAPPDIKQARMQAYYNAPALIGAYDPGGSSEMSAPTQMDLKAKGAEITHSLAEADDAVARASNMRIKNQTQSAQDVATLNKTWADTDATKARLPGIVAESTFKQYQSQSATPAYYDKAVTLAHTNNNKINLERAFLGGKVDISGKVLTSPPPVGTIKGLSQTDVNSLRQMGVDPTNLNTTMTPTDVRNHIAILQGLQNSQTQNNAKLNQMTTINPYLAGDPQALMGQRLQELLADGGTEFGKSGCVRGARAFAKALNVPFPQGSDNVKDIQSAFPKFGIVPTTDPSEATFFIEKGSGGPNNPSGLHMGGLVGGKVAFQADTHGSTKMQRTAVPTGKDVIYYKATAPTAPQGGPLTNPPPSQGKGMAVVGNYSGTFGNKPFTGNVITGPPPKGGTFKHKGAVIPWSSANPAPL